VAGVVLGVIGTVQLVFAAALLLGIQRTRPFVASFSVAAAALWTLATSSGLPIGPHPWAPETVTAPGIGVTVLELALAAVLFVLPPRRGAHSDWKQRHASGPGDLLGAPTWASPYFHFAAPAPPLPPASFAGMASPGAAAVPDADWPPPPTAGPQAPPAPPPASFDVTPGGSA